ncbi:MAG: T9SS type A sorting domain-containing protein, partial [bacterium]
NMAPSFGDLDNDGDLDMVCGSSDGLLHFFRNIAAAGQPISLQFVPNYFGSIDLGNNTTPFIFDLNNDTKPEIIVGERFFNINLISNTGTPTNPNYVLTTDSLWKIDVGKKLRYPSGRTSVSIAKLNPLTNENHLLISNGNGKIYIYKNLPSSYTEAIQNFAVSDDSIYVSNGNYGGGNVGFHISVADINADLLPEIITGTPQGGVLLFLNQSNFSSVSNTTNNSSINIYPNPCYDKINVNSDFAFDQIKIYNINGQIIKTIEGKVSEINILDLSNGIYFLECSGNSKIATQKFIVNK